MKKSVLSSNWPFMAMGGLIVAILLSTGISAFAQTSGNKAAFKVFYGTSLTTIEGRGTLQSIDVDIDANRVSSADMAYNTGWIIDVVRTKNGFVTLNVDDEIFVYKNTVFGPPSESFAVPSAMSLAVRDEAFVLTRYQGYIVRAVRTPQGLRTGKLNKSITIPSSSVTVTSDDYIVSYGLLDHRVVVHSIDPVGKLVQVNEFKGLGFGSVLAMSIAGDDLFLLGYFVGDTSCTLWKFSGFSSGAPEAVPLGSGMPVLPRVGHGNVIAATYANDGSLGVFLLGNYDDHSVAIWLFQPGIGVRKVTGDDGVRYTAIRAFPADMP